MQVRPKPAIARFLGALAGRASSDLLRRHRWRQGKSLPGGVPLGSGIHHRRPPIRVTHACAPHQGFSLAAPWRWPERWTPPRVFG